jgi:ribonuclease VapC
VESRRGEAAGRELDLFLHRTKIEIVAVDAEQFSILRGENMGKAVMRRR